MDEELLKEITVLYVEDEEIVQKAIASIIRRRVNQLFLASNGEEGLEQFMLNRQVINLIITDIEMPIMNGIEMIQKIKEIDKDAPIIIVTAYNDSEHKSDLADFLILKPVKKEELFDAMEKSIIKYLEKKKVVL